MKKFISVIILNWNGGEEIIGCIEHVLMQKYSFYEIIVIDNASEDKSIDKIREKYPEIIIIENKENFGYAKGMNQGISISSGEYVILLNQDAWLHEEFFFKAISIMNKYSCNVGVLAFKVYKLKGLEKTNYLIGGGHYIRKRFQLIKDQDVSSVHYTFSPIYCSPFFRKKMLDDIKTKTGYYFDESYFAYGEDLDLAIRGLLLDWKCLFVPELIVWHEQSSSQKGRIRIWEKDYFTQINSLRNRISTIIKDIPFPIIARLIPYLIATEILIVPYLLCKKPSSVISIYKAYSKIIRNSKILIRDRKRIQKSRRISLKEMNSYFRGI